MFKKIMLFLVGYAAIKKQRKEKQDLEKKLNEADPFRSGRKMNGSSRKAW